VINQLPATIEHLDKFRRCLNNKFECNDCGPANYFLGVTIAWDKSHRLSELGQQRYVDKTLAESNMKNCDLVTEKFTEVNVIDT